MYTISQTQYITKQEKLIFCALVKLYKTVVVSVKFMKNIEVISQKEIPNEIINLSEIKSFLKISADDTSHDDNLLFLRSVAISHAEEQMKISIIPCELLLRYDFENEIHVEYTSQFEVVSILLNENILDRNDYNIVNVTKNAKTIIFKDHKDDQKVDVTVNTKSAVPFSYLKQIIFALKTHIEAMWIGEQDIFVPKVSEVIYTNYKNAIKNFRI
jgi:hypothetical protein